MKKIKTLFKKDPKDLSKTIPELHPDNLWVKKDDIFIERKYNGTSCAVIKDTFYKRYDAKLFKRKKGKKIYFTEKEVKRKIPQNSIPCQDPDPITGHWPHWIPVLSFENENKYHVEGYNNTLREKKEIKEGTYELCGPKINGNPENFKKHLLIPHITENHFPINMDYLFEPDSPQVLYEKLKAFLLFLDIEGFIIYHKNEDKLCKIRKNDFRYR